MPLAQSSIVDPGEVESKAPLKKSTVVWMVAGVMMLAVAGVFLPKFFKSESSQAVKKDKPIGVGSTRQIDGEFEDAARRAAREAQQAAQAKQAASAAQAKAMLLPGGPPVHTAASGVNPIVPPDARRDGNSVVMYGKQMDSVSGTGGGTIEMDAAARNSASVKNDFGDSSTSLVAQAMTDKDSVSNRLKALMPEPTGQSASAPSPSQSVADRLAAVVEAQRRGEQPSIGRGADRAWLKEFPEAARPTPLKPYTVSNPYTLLQGKVLPAVLGGDLNTDLPSGITAYITENVYDSLSSRYLLIPRGSVLIGRYSNAIKTGQERILFAFERIILPNGVGVDLPGFSGADVGGAAGIAGDVNNHFFQQFGSSFLIAFLADRADKGKTTIGGNGQGEAISSAGKVLSDVSNSILSRSKSIDPTITVSKGTPILVSVAKDIEFTSPYRSSSR
jgi:type IV secretion system protein VirB10